MSLLLELVLEVSELQPLLSLVLVLEVSELQPLLSLVLVLDVSLEQPLLESDWRLLEVSEEQLSLLLPLSE